MKESKRVQSEAGIRFPEGFVFGAATASYQIEGAVDMDGRGPSIWDTFSHTPGKIKCEHNGDTACDHYNRYREDVEIMDSLGLDAYRFSIAWSRVLPEGEGEINEKGIDFYSRLVDSLLEKRITPYVTLFHWDLPQALQDRYEGFASKRIIDIFADYAELIVRRLGDRVENWITFNEPWVYAVLGHYFRAHAPGRKSMKTAFRVAHNQLVAHGKAVQRIRTFSPQANAGITLNLMPVFPETDRPKDRKAAGIADQFLNRFFLDPLFKGKYPDELWKRAKFVRPETTAEEMDLIGEPIDFLGINYYSRQWARHSWRRPFFFFDMTGQDVPEGDFVKDGVQYTSMGWEVYPEGIDQLLLRIKNEYGNIPTYITENGAAFEDEPVEENGEMHVHDPKRVDFLEKYLEKVSRAVEEGANLKGYFVWSLMDNFEWAEGYRKRFGVVYVDYESERRIIKDSGYWYRDFIEKSRYGKNR